VMQSDELVTFAFLEDPRVGRFEFAIIQYEFPELTAELHSDTDANWLVVECRVVCEQARWIFREACLLTQEVIELIDWFRHPARPDPLGFMEPLLEFEWNRADSRSLVIRFSHEAAPPWIALDQRACRSFEMRFKLEGDAAVSFAESVFQMLQRFPPR